MTKAGFVNIYAAGDVLLLAPMAGWGGGYKEIDAPVRHAPGDAGLDHVIESQLDASDLRPDAFDQPGIPTAKTGYAKAAAIAKRRQLVLRGFNLFRDDGGALTLQPLAPVVRGRGLAPDGPESHPRDIAHAAALIREALAD